MQVIKMVDKNYEYFYRDEGFGPSMDQRAVDDSKLRHYESKLPSRLLEYWREYGFAGYGDGLFWMTDPDEYALVLEQWIKGTPFDGADKYHVIGKTAFGKLFIWGEKTGPCMKILPAWAMIFPRSTPTPIAPEEADFLIATWLSGMDKENLDEMDENEDPLFKRALQTLGKLEADEIYGFVPALSIGGAARLNHLQRVKAIEHLTLLAHLGPPQVMRDVVKEAKDAGLW